MNKEEINYCLEHFKNNKVGYCFANGFEISLFKVFEQLNDLDERINKAIGHINACGCELSKDETRYLLEILKGGSNE